MRRLTTLCFASALAAVLLATPVQAGVKWSYSASDTAVYNTNNPGKTSAVLLDGASNNVEGDSGIIIYRLQTVFNPNNTNPVGYAGPDSFDGTAAAAYSLNVTITDTDSQEQGVAVFNGRFKGKNFTPASFSAPKDAFTWDSPLVQNFTLGGRNYRIEITSATPPGAPGDPGGAIYADVTIDGPQGGGEAPEPATLAMAGFGIPVLFALRRRMKKNS